jgi:CheY-like chemotaxis protein
VLIVSDKKRVLLVEDQAMLAKMMRLELLDEGHDVTLAANGVEAKAFLDSQPFDVLVTEVYMPDMDGIELIRQVKQQMSLPTIVLSASRFSDIKAEIEQLGVELFIDKPITDEKLTLLLHLISVL